MKPITVLLLASLGANVALVSLIYNPRSVVPGAATEAVAKPRTPAAAADDATAGAAGLSPEGTRDLALGRAMARYATAMRSASGKSADGKWWARPDASRLTREQREQIAQARRELSAALLAATGSDFMGGNNAGDAGLAFLPEAKRDQLRRILSDYQDLMEQYGPVNGVQLASDREKLNLLRAERERDIAALLSPEELADYQMRTSPSAEAIRNRYGSAIADEDQFKKLYALQKAFDDRFPPENFTGRVTPDAMKARSDAALQLQADMRAAVGDEAYAALRRASDSDLRSVDALVARLSLAPDTTDRVAAARDRYAAESQRIMADTATPIPQRREQLQALATRATSDLTSALGADAADAYAQRSPWVAMLQSGIGFSTTPTANSPSALALSGAGGPSVFPVLPAGAGGSLTRQVMNVMTSDHGSGADGGAMIFTAGNGGPVTNTQVIAVSSATFTESRGPGDTPGTATTRSVVAPPAESPPPTPPPKE